MFFFPTIPKNDLPLSFLPGGHLLNIRPQEGTERSYRHTIHQCFNKKTKQTKKKTGSQPEVVTQDMVRTFDC